MYFYFLSRLIAEVNQASFSCLHKHSFSFFSNNFSGSLVKKVNYFARAIEDILDNIIWSLIPLVVYGVIIVWVLWQRNFIMGAGTLVWLLIFFFSNFFFSNWKYKFNVEANEAVSRNTAFLADTITNFSSLKLFNGYQRETKRFSELSEELRRKNRFTWNMDEIFNAISALLMIILEVGLFYYSIILWREKIFTPGDFVMVQSYAILIINQSWQFGRMIRGFYRSFSDAEEMTVLLLSIPEILDKPGAKELKIAEGKIEFSKVLFCYHETRQVLCDFNLQIRGGEKVALIGPSGAGKTTVIKLLLRNYDLTGGHILIDGQDTAGVTQESLWQSISLVPQDPVLFHRTLKENIRYGRPEATDAEVLEASKMAHCDEFIADLPESYETFVGERGIKLSGGERQRVAIARAILRNSPILVLDEATSSLDSESEGLIQDALEKLMKDKTVIVIAHRLSTIRKMDRIIFIDEGQIKEEGTHEDLEKKENGLYRHLWELQAGGFMK
jgi:ATP-binding cassette subfamily B protein